MQLQLIAFSSAMAQEMQWWDWVILISGVIAALTGFIAAIGVILNELRNFQNKPRVEWMIGHRLTAQPAITLRNSGDSNARDVFVDFYQCEPKSNENPFVVLLGPNEVHEFEMESIEDDAWLTVMYVDPSNSRRRIITWVPVADEELREEYIRQRLQSPFQKLIARIRYGKALGPHIQSEISMSSTPRGMDKMRRKLRSKNVKSSKRFEKRHKRLGE